MTYLPRPLHAGQRLERLPSEYIHWGQWIHWLSRAGYVKGHRQPGLYRVVDPDGHVYEVYCHFDSDGAWTLVQSYSFANRAMKQFRRPLFDDLPLNEIALTWRGYRHSKARMSFIKRNSTLLLFTFDYEKHYNVSKSNFFEVPLKRSVNFKGDDLGIFSLKKAKTTAISKRRGKIVKVIWTIVKSILFKHRCRLCMFVSITWLMNVNSNQLAFLEKYSVFVLL